MLRVLRIVTPALMAGVMAFVSAGIAFAQEKRVALVVGNSKYRLGGTLKNPVEDAAAMQVALHRLNFELIVGQDLSLEQFREKLREFSKSIKGADIALLFYAGHGIQYKEQNYLLPTDAELKSEEDITQRTIRLNQVLEDMGLQAKASVIFLDACRDAPPVRSVATRAPATATGSLPEGPRGLATITASPADRFVGFAAAPGTVAQDGHGKNSPFTTALLHHISTANLEIGSMFTAVRRDVLKITALRQQPEALNALQHPLYLKRTETAGGSQIVEPAPPQEDTPPAIALSADAEFWFVIKDSNDPKNFEDYLQLFPKGKFTLLAKRKVDGLKVASAKAPEPARPVRLAHAELATFEGEFVLATGIARIGKSHPRKEAQRTARALARARAIASKLPQGSVVLPLSYAESSADAAQLLAYMSRGITYDEVWSQNEPSNNVVKVDLRAKVRVLGEHERKLMGSVDPTEVVSGQNLRVKLTAKKDATVGVFAWQADGTVLRLYPDTPQRPVLVKGGETLLLPRANDAYPAIGVSNMPGEQRNHEAMIVVTGGGKIAYERLVPPAIAETAQHTAAYLLGGGEFLSRLAALDDPELEVLVLPYEIRAER